MTTPATVSKDDPALRALVATAGRAALEALEADRAERRSAVLAAHRVREEAARASVASAAVAIAPLRARLDAALAAVNAARAALRAAEGDLAQRSDAREALTNRLCAELDDLGHQAVVEAHAAIAGVLWRTQAAGAYEVKYHLDPFARRAASTFDVDDGGTPQKVARLQAALDQLEVLRFADLSPAAIEGTCSALVEWANAGADGLMPGGTAQPRGFVAKAAAMVKGVLA